jgi:hypothetical protein
MTTLARALAYATLFVALVLVFCPRQPRRASAPTAFDAPQLAGAIVTAAGAAVAVCASSRSRSSGAEHPRRSILHAGWSPAGPIGAYAIPCTGAPWPPGRRTLLRSGALWAYAMGFLVLMYLLVVCYEEPTLRRSFGATTTRTAGRHDGTDDD